MLSSWESQAAERKESPILEYSRYILRQFYNIVKISYGSFISCGLTVLAFDQYI